MLSHEINALDHRCARPVTRVVHDLDPPQSRPRRNADDPIAVVQRRRNPRHVGAVSVPVDRLTGNKTDVGIDVQIEMRRDAGVQNRNVHVHPLVQAIDFRHRRHRRADSFDACRDGLRGRKQLQFGLDEIDPRVLAERLEAFAGNFAGKSVQGMRKNVMRLETVLASDIVGLVSVLEHDDIPARHGVRLNLFSPRVHNR